MVVCSPNGNSSKSFFFQCKIITIWLIWSPLNKLQFYMHEKFIEKKMFVALTIYEGFDGQKSVEKSSEFKIIPLCLTHWAQLIGT